MYLCIYLLINHMFLSLFVQAHFYSGHMPIIPHAKFGFILLIILAIALTIFFVFKFRLIKAIGIAFVCMYVLFLAYAFTQELYCVRKQGIYC